MHQRIPTAAQMNARWWWRSDWLDSQFEVCFLFLFIVFAHDLVRQIPVNIWKGLLALWQIKYVRHHTKTKTFTHNKNWTENGRTQRSVETKHRNYKTTKCMNIPIASSLRLSFCFYFSFSSGGCISSVSSVLSVVSRFNWALQVHRSSYTHTHMAHSCIHSHYLTTIRQWDDGT